MDRDERDPQDHTNNNTNEINADRPSVETAPVMTPVNRVGHRIRYTANYWEDYSPKLKRYVGFYRDLEYDHWLLIESDPTIVWFCEYPLTIQMRIGAHNVTSTLNVMVQHQDGEREVRRLVYADELNASRHGSRLRRQIEAERTWCRLHGIRYVLITDETIYKTPLLISNWKFILRVLKDAEAIDVAPQQREIEPLLDAEGRSIGEIEKAFRHIDPATLKVAIYRLLQQGQLVAPLDKELLSKTTTVRRAYVGHTAK